MAVTTVWAAVLIIYGVFAGTAMDSASAVLPLDLAPNSVDDMYDGCRDDMAKKMVDSDGEFLQNEKNINPTFKEAWKWAGEEYNNKKAKPKLGREQAMALYIYSYGPGDKYRDINDAVRTQRANFKYRALHFYLTDAIQTLNTRKPEAERCVKSYRRVDVSFSQDVLGKEFRFGSFTSSKKGAYPKAERFGEKSCFKIKTCYGADISLYSKFEIEAEVLIPPYEVFTVTQIKRKSEDKTLPCDVEYKVESTRTQVNFNCALFPNLPK